MLNPLLPTYVFQFILSYINFYSNFVQKKKKLTAAFFTDLLQNPDKVFFRQTLDKNEDSVMYDFEYFTKVLRLKLSTYLLQFDKEFILSYRSFGPEDKDQYFKINSLNEKKISR